MKIRSAGYQQVCLKSVPVYTLQGFITLFSFYSSSFILRFRPSREALQRTIGRNECSRLTVANWYKVLGEPGHDVSHGPCCWGVRIVLPMFSLKQSVIFYPSPSSISVYTYASLITYGSFSCALHIMKHSLSRFYTLILASTLQDSCSNCSLTRRVVLVGWRVDLLRSVSHANSRQDRSPSGATAAHGGSLRHGPGDSGAVVLPPVPLLQSHCVLGHPAGTPASHTLTLTTTTTHTVY